MNDQMASTASSCITTGTTTTTSSSIRSINELASVGTPVAPIETQSFQQEDPLVDFMEMNAETHDGTLPTVEGGAIIESASMVESITTTTTTTTLLSHSRVPRERDSSATVTTTFAASQPPLVSLSSSLHRTTMTTRTTTPTPTYFSANDPIVDAWIQQSLTMPSIKQRATGSLIFSNRCWCDGHITTSKRTKFGLGNIRTNGLCHNIGHYYGLSSNFRCVNNGNIAQSRNFTRMGNYI
jgi:hypothetical protein